MSTTAFLSSLGTPLTAVSITVLAIGILVSFVLLRAFASSKAFATVEQVFRFCYNCFLKPHTRGKSGTQQDALESFYSAQASIYDATRSRLLHGREDMLGLVSAQLKQRIEAGTLPSKPIWVDVGGGTGYNIEQLGRLVDVPSLFGAVFLVDFSPSLCKIAEERFARLGWKNVKVICQDARHFNLEDHEDFVHNLTHEAYPLDSPRLNGRLAHVITMSYSLSMIPEYYPVVDSVAALLAPSGIIGVADFYVQSEVDYQSRNYLGGGLDRHCMWISRVFWRTWFEADRVSLEAARRDYLEYRFGTILSFNARCHLVGFRIPYYVWIGCAKDSGTSQLRLAELNAAATESPYLCALDLQTKAVKAAQQSSAIEIRSKAYESAVINLAASLPLPASWYQTHHWRIYYDDQLQKHKQFNDEYIYAFTWEDSRADARILKIQQDDVILAITSAGDNILAYALEKPKRIHAVDLNPSQNHLLELKVAAFTALGYADMWKLFGDGTHASFRDLLITKLSPHLSSLAFQFWLHNGPAAFSGKGLYHTGGSRHALKLAYWLFRLVGLVPAAERMCEAQTMNEQREIWHRHMRRVLLSRLLGWTVISNKQWLWKALGVPAAQREMIERDHARHDRDGHVDVTPLLPPAAAATAAVAATAAATAAPLEATKRPVDNLSGYGSGRAIWEYAVNTLDPVVNHTLVAADNHYYHVCLRGRYSRRCHPDYLTPRAHAALSRPGALAGLRIHTDEVNDVVERIAPGTLTIAVVMDSMDWFDPSGAEADAQIERLHRALKIGGRVLLRSAGLEPWYVKRFEALGFAPKRVAARFPGTCIDRVNMYASTWVCTKVALPEPRHAGRGRRSTRVMEPLSIGAPIMEED